MGRGVEAPQQCECPGTPGPPVGRGGGVGSWGSARTCLCPPPPQPAHLCVYGAGSPGGRRGHINAVCRATPALPPHGGGRLHCGATTPQRGERTAPSPPLKQAARSPPCPEILGAEPWPRPIRSVLPGSGAGSPHLCPDFSGSARGRWGGQGQECRQRSPAIGPPGAQPHAHTPLVCSSSTALWTWQRRRGGRSLCSAGARRPTARSSTAGSGATAMPRTRRALHQPPPGPSTAPLGQRGLS